MGKRRQESRTSAGTAERDKEKARRRGAGLGFQEVLALVTF